MILAVPEGEVVKVHVDSSGRISWGRSPCESYLSFVKGEGGGSKV